MENPLSEERPVQHRSCGRIEEYYPYFCRWWDQYQLALATGKLGFACLCRIWGREDPRPSRPTELVKKRRSENVLLMQGMPDAGVVDLTFSAIAQVWANIDRN